MSMGPSENQKVSIEKIKFASRETARAVARIVHNSTASSLDFLLLTMVLTTVVREAFGRHFSLGWYLVLGLFAAAFIYREVFIPKPTIELVKTQTNN